MGKNKSGTNGEVGGDSWWEDDGKYGNGSFGMLFNCQVFNPEFLGGRFTWNEFGFLATLTFVAFKYRDWRILATEPFIKRGLAHRGIGSSGSIKRFKKKWIEAGYLERVRYGGLSGNEYLVSSLLITPHSAREMAHYDEAARLVAKAAAKFKKEKAEAEEHLKWLEAEKLKKQKAWLRECLRAKAAGQPEPPAENYL